MRVLARWRAVAVDVTLGALALLDGWLSIDYARSSELSLVVLAAGALLVRRRHPVLTFGLTLPALFSGYVLIAPLVALYTVARDVRGWRVTGVCAVIVGLGYLLPWPPSHVDVAALFRQPLGLIYGVVFAGAPVALGLLVRTREELSDRLGELIAGRQREQQLVTHSVLAEERTRLAREMHDVVSHQVSLIAVQAGALRTTADDPDVQEAADTIRELSVATLAELRQMVGVLRSSAGQTLDLAPQPCIKDIPRLLRDSGQDVTLDTSLTVGHSWPDPVERAAYRTVQEALTNVSKHAPGAPVSVVLAPSSDGGLRVTVHNGPPRQAPRPGPGLTGGGHGLVGLQERAQQLGGTLRVESAQDGIFTLEALFGPAGAGPGSPIPAHPAACSSEQTAASEVTTSPSGAGPVRPPPVDQAPPAARRATPAG